MRVPPVIYEVSKGQRLKLMPVGWGASGDALAYHGDIKVMVFGGMPDEEVEVEVVGFKKHYVAARVVQALNPSPHRVSPPCSYFGPCTGCQWQHIDYQYQLTLKQRMVADSLERIGGISDVPVAPTVPSPMRFGYRNHARFTVGKDGSLGFVNRETRRFIPIDSCMLMDPLINRTLGELQGRCAETTQLSIRGGDGTGSYLVQPALKSPDISVPSGQKTYDERLGDRSFRIAAASFFQVNGVQADRMVSLAREELKLAGSGLLVDAYAGVGTFAILLAPYVDRVVAIEDSPSAVWDGEFNAAGIENITFIRGRTEEVLTQMNEPPTALILDPPRTGCRPEAVEAVVKLNPRRLLYISCDPDSLARDLKLLRNGGFRIEKVQPIDMFPQTHHVECMVTLTGRSVDGGSSFPVAVDRGLVLASASPRRTQLLSELGVEHEIVHPSVDESVNDGESPVSFVERLALAKGRKVSKEQPSKLVIGADSAVVLDGKAIGKPADASEATEVLKMLRGRTHSVITGVALVDSDSGREWVASCTTSVMMRFYSDQEIAAYTATSGPLDKAGSYGIQDETFGPVASVDGCYTNVMGLPLCVAADLLERAGSPVSPSGSLSITERCSKCMLGAAAYSEGTKVGGR